MQLTTCFRFFIGLIFLIAISCTGCGPCVPNDEQVSACHEEPGYYWDYELCECVQD